MNSVKEQFGRNVKRHRLRLGIAQEELGYRAGIHRTQISEIERAKVLPQIDKLVKLCGALNAEPNDLLSGMGWEPPQLPLAPPGGRFVGES